MQNRLFFVVIFLLSVVCGITAADKFVLVIDAGHGGKDSGALGKRSAEKNINLPVALAFGKYVENNCPDVKVVYTRKTDVFVELNERANIANRNKADLFISIHTNALEGGKIARGFQTYTMGMHNAAENLNVAKRENSVILIEKNYKQRYAGFDPKSSESYIMFELMQDKNMANSVDLAKTVQSEVCAYSGRLNKGVHQAGLLVLRETSMPGCLIELGFITTQDEEEFLNSKEGQDKLAKGIFNAFVKYKKKHGKRKLAQNEEDESVSDEPLLAETNDGALDANEQASDSLNMEEWVIDNKGLEQDKEDAPNSILDEDERLLSQNEVFFVEQRAVRGLASPSLVAPPSLISQNIPDAQEKVDLNVVSQPEPDKVANDNVNSSPPKLKSPELQEEKHEEKHEGDTPIPNIIEDKPSSDIVTSRNDEAHKQDSIIDAKPLTQEQDLSHKELVANEKAEIPDSSFTAQPLSSNITKEQPLLEDNSNSIDDLFKPTKDSIVIANNIQPNPISSPKLPDYTLMAKATVAEAHTAEATVAEANKAEPTVAEANKAEATVAEPTTEPNKAEPNKTEANKAINVAKTNNADSNVNKLQQRDQKAKQIAKSSNPAIKPAANSKNVDDKVKAVGKTIFKVQIFSSSESHAMDTTFFKGMKGIEKFNENGMVKYTVGNTENFAEIQELRSSLVEDFPGAFIIAFKDEKKISLQDAIAEYRKQKQTRR
ncbi:MAG: N-acetylmuramoyl-L-alanine amidase [Prevotella sp.]|nr:N-acetylmuramoyl-L-alanine amidase [Prevotella sp.]